MGTPSDANELVRISWHRNKWVRIAAIVVFGLIVTAIVAAMAFWALWNSRPEKALFDSIDYALSQPGAYHIKSKDADIRLWVNGQQYQADGVFSGIPVQFVGSANLLYIRSSNPQALADKITSVPKQGALASIITPELNNLKDRWISVNLQGQSFRPALVDQFYCTTNTRDALSGNTASRREAYAAYTTNSFLKLTKANENGDVSTYDVSFESSKYDSFAAELRNSELLDSSSGCDSVELPDGKQLENVSVTLDITKAQHRIKKMTIHDNSNHDTVVTADYDAKHEITLPTDAIDMDQLLNGFFKSFIQSSIQRR